MATPLNGNQDLLKKFELADKVSVKREAIIPLLLRGKKSELLKTPEFQNGLKDLLRKIDDVSEFERIGALSLARRLAASINVRGFSKEIDEALEKPIPPLSASPSLLENSTDRRYLGEALRKTAGDWLPNYLAKAAIGEPATSKARVAFLEALLQKRSDLSQALEDLSTAFDHFRIDTKDVTTSRGRRLVSILTSLREAIVKVDPPVADGVGRSIARLISSALAGETIGDRALQRQLAIAVLALLHDVVRLHFSLATAIDTFAALPIIRRIFPDSQWPAATNESQTALSRLVREALVLLTKQGIADDKLRRQLIDLVGKERAATELEEIAAKSAGISNDLREWLVRGEFRRQLGTEKALEETILTTFDRTLSLLLLSALSLANLTDRLHEDIFAAVRTYDPKLQEEVARLTSVASQCVTLIQQIASARALRPKGRAGEVVEFNAIEHEPPASGKSSRRVRLRAPVVERAPAGSLPSVILKADVDVVE
jgi:hypothetical protein